MKKVCFFTKYYQYERNRYFTEKLNEAIIRAGIETKIFDLDDAKIQQNQITSIKAFQPDFTLSFHPLNALEDNHFLCDLLKIPHLTILLEPSLYFVNLINSPFSIISCVDHFDCYGLSTQNFDRVFFMPHAVERELCEKEELKQEYDVVFFGSCYDYKTIETLWQSELSKLESDLILRAVEILLTNKPIPLQEALILSWKESGLDFKEVNFLKLFRYIDQYSRGLDRVNLIKNIKHPTVHVFGNFKENALDGSKGWRELLNNQSNVVIHSGVEYKDSLEIMRRSKICLNSSPFFKNGSHERIIFALAANALVISNESLFIDENFPNISTYTSNNYQKIENTINYYLDNEKDRKKIVETYKIKILKDHTWDSRVSLFLEIMPKMISQTKPFIKL